MQGLMESFFLKEIIYSVRTVNDRSKINLNNSLTNEVTAHTKDNSHPNMKTGFYIIKFSLGN
jgi:hypothetical protein